MALYNPFWLNLMGMNKVHMAMPSLCSARHMHTNVAFHQKKKMNQRIFQIDALRGFALFGILIVNIFVFHAPYPYYGEFYSQFEGMNRNIVDNMIFFFGGKFMFIYAFLFGYNFWIQYEKSQELSKFRKYWNRRLLLLACFGIVHVLLFSFGDILMPYAILGFTLPLFAKLSNTRIFIWFLLINFIPVYEFVLRGFLEFPSIFMQPNETLSNYLKINSQGSFIDISILRVRDYFSFGNEKLIMYVPKEISLFLFGILASRNKLATDVKKVNGIIFCLFALINVGVMYFFRPQIISFFNFEESLSQRIFLGFIIHISEFLHGLLYVVGFFMLWELPIFKKLFYPLTYTGKISLTNYIMQSIICVFLFSGLGYYGKLTPLELIICALAIYMIQILFSILWLRRRKYGPLEFIWRRYSKNKL